MQSSPRRVSITSQRDDRGLLCRSRRTPSRALLTITAGSESPGSKARHIARTAKPTDCSELVCGKVCREKAGRVHEIRTDNHWL